MYVFIRVSVGAQCMWMCTLIDIRDFLCVAPRQQVWCPPNQPICQRVLGFPPKECISPEVSLRLTSWQIPEFIFVQSIAALAFSRFYFCWTQMIHDSWGIMSFLMLKLFTWNSLLLLCILPVNTRHFTSTLMNRMCTTTNAQSLQ